MRPLRSISLSALATVLAACSGSQAVVGVAGEDPVEASQNLDPAVEVLTPPEATSLAVGESLEIRWIAFDSDDTALTTITAFGLEGAASIELATDVPEQDGAEQSVVWTPLEADLGKYEIRAVTRDRDTEARSVAPGEVEVVPASVDPDLASGAAVLTHGGYGGTVHGYGDGSFVVTGHFEGGAPLVVAPGDPNETTFLTDSFDAYVARFAPDGSLVWSARTHAAGPLGAELPAWSGGQTAGSVGLRDSAPMSDGGVVLLLRLFGRVVVGEGESAIEFETEGERELIVVYDALGELSWARFDSDNSDLDTSTTDPRIAVTSDGRVAVVGEYFGETLFGFGEPNETVLHGDGLYLAFFSSDGELLSARTLVEHFAGYVYEVALAVTDDGLWLAGLFDGPVTFGAGEAAETVLAPLNGNAEDQLIARYSLDGSLHWARHSIAQLGDGQEPYAASIVVDGTGEATVLSGNMYDGTYAFGVGGQNEQTFAAGDTDFASLAHYTIDGDLEWVEILEGDLDSLDDPYASEPLAATANGDLLLALAFEDTLTGSAFEVSAELPPGLGTLLVARFDADGELVHAFNDGGLEEEPEQPSIIELAGERVFLLASAIGEDGVDFYADSETPEALFGAGGAFTVRAIYTSAE